MHLISDEHAGNPSRNIWLVALSLIVATASVILINGWHSYHLAEADARARMTSKAKLVETQIASLVRNIDFTLDQVILESSGETRCNQQLIERLGRFHPEFRAITIIDRAGINHCSSLPELIGLDRSVEDYVRRVLAAPVPDTLTIEKPFVSKLSGVPILVMQKAAVNPAGRLRFIAQVSIDLRYLDRLLAPLRENNQVVVLLHESGQIVSHQPEPDKFRLMDVSGKSAVFDEHRREGASLTEHQICNATDGVDRLSSMMDVVPERVVLAPGGKILVGVGEAASDVFAEWYRQATVRALAWLMLVAAILVLTRKVVKGRRRLLEQVVHQRRTMEELMGVSDQLSQHRDALEQHVIVSIADLRGGIVYANSKFSEVSGYSNKELLGNNHRILKSNTHPPEFYRDMWQTIAAGNTWHGLVCNRAKDGHLYWVDSTIVPMRDGKGRIDNYYSFRTDVSAFVLAQKTIMDSERELRLAKEEAEQARDQAAIANRQKSLFLANMSHEIRTPMNGVLGMLEVLHQTSLRGEQVEMVETVRESAFSLLDIIEDILDFSKIEAGKLELERVPVSIAEVVEKACAMLDPLAVKKRVFLTLFVDPELPVEVLGDAPRLRQIVVNLVNNAIKFCGGQERRGRVSVRAVLAAGGEGQRVVDISVADNGIGIDAAVQARLFQAFSQADNSTTRQFGGTGLGLVIVRNLVELMGGEIAVHSAPGAGATFTVRLPCITAASKEAAAASPVAGLDCLAIGAEGGLAEDWAAYLKAAGARVERVPDMEAARACPVPAEAGPWVWLLDAIDAPPAPEALQAVIQAHPAVRFVVVEHGQRRRARVFEDTRVVGVDVNTLTREHLLKAVGIASGRAREERNAAAPRKQEAAPVPPSREEAMRQGRLILVAEDNETNSKLILQQLTLLGYAAEVARDGSEALQLWKDGDYALLLTDLNMPIMDGYQLAAAIRRGEGEAGGKGGQRLPIVALTANALKGEAGRCKNVGMDGYLTKPASLARLQAMLEQWLPAPRLSPDEPGAAANPPASTPPAVLDTAVLAKLVGDDQAIIENIMNDYRRTTQSLAEQIRAALAQGDWKTVGQGAHKLKSSSRAVGAQALGEVCARLDQGQEQYLAADVAARLAADFEQALAAVFAALDRRQS